jgi:hypothetical protein
MGSLHKKIRRKKIHKARKTVIRQFQKLPPDQREAQLEKAAAAIEFLDQYVETGKLPGYKKETPKELLDEIDALSKEVEVDEENRKAGSD